LEVHHGRRAAAGALEDLGEGHWHARRDVGQIVRFEAERRKARIDARDGVERLSGALDLGRTG
jgi:hypothetical protein